MTGERRQQRIDLRLAKLAVQRVIHDPSRSAEVRQRARLAAVQAQKLIEDNE